MQQHNPAILMSRLKQETEGLHARLEKLPYFIALADGVLPLAAYVNQLWNTRRQP
jgi:heme oxygenase